MDIEDKLDFKEFKKTIKQYKAREEEKVILNINVVLDLINKIDEQQAELKKKDKVINLMIEEGSHIPENELYKVEKIYREVKDKTELKGRELKIYCIKQYFTNKVEKEGVKVE